jgi:hypothetical protein
VRLAIRESIKVVVGSYAIERETIAATRNRCVQVGEAKASRTVGVIAHLSQRTFEAVSQIFFGFAQAQ